MKRNIKRKKGRIERMVRDRERGRNNLNRKKTKLMRKKGSKNFKKKEGED